MVYTVGEECCADSVQTVTQAAGGFLTNYNLTGVTSTQQCEALDFTNS